MAIKLIAIDLDDTLLDNRQQLSPRTLAVLQQAMRNGVAVTIATGRMFQSALPFATELGIKLPLITYNGALIRQGDNGETIFHRPIETELAQELADLFRRRNWYLQKYVDDRLYVAELDENARFYADYANVEVNKGQALDFLAGRLGILQHEVMAIGDSMNDLDMIQYAGIGVAMGNANPTVRAAADFVTLGNSEDGVAAAVEKFALS